MTNEKLHELFTMYAKRIRQAYPGVPAARMDVASVRVLTSSVPVIYGHLLWMCDEGIRFVETKRYEKAFRWLGFLQGMLFANGHFTVEELGQHSMPPPAPYTANYVLETMRSLELRRAALDVEGAETKNRCSHANNDATVLKNTYSSGEHYCPACDRVIRSDDR